MKEQLHAVYECFDCPCVTLHMFMSIQVLSNTSCETALLGCTGASFSCLQTHCSVQKTCHEWQNYDLMLLNQMTIA